MSSSSLVQAFARTLSPMLLGCIVMFPLFGIAIAQATYYYRTYRTDHYSMKSSVTTIMILDILHFACITHAVKTLYFRATVDFSEPITLPISIFFSYATTALVQSVFSYRVWLFSKSRPVIASLIVLIAIQFGSGMNMAKGQINATSSANDHSIENRVSGSIELSSAILCDIVISVALVHFLRIGRSGIKRTEKMIDLLITYAIGIGSLTVIISALNLATWLALPSKLIYVAFHIVLSKLYVNSLLISLNSRNMLRTWGSKRAPLWESDNTLNPIL